MTEIAEGTEAEASWIVQEGDLASRLSDAHSGSFPDVFSTSRLVALMELAAARALRPMLAPGQLSVGVLVDIVHTAATPPGVRVRATARYTGRAGKAYAFEVVAYDPAGEIGRGRHHRAIIDSERLVRGAAKRGGAA
ncbi:MAG TPA: thioesterase [Thermoanaerobaculia bacterium]